MSSIPEWDYVWFFRFPVNDGVYTINGFYIFFGQDLVWFT